MHNKIIAVVLSTIVIIFTCIFIFKKDTEFSENEILELVKTNNFSDKRISVLNNVIK